MTDEQQRTLRSHNKTGTVPKELPGRQKNRSDKILNEDDIFDKINPGDEDEQSLQSEARGAFLPDIPFYDAGKNYAGKNLDEHRERYNLAYKPVDMEYNQHQRKQTRENYLPNFRDDFTNQMHNISRNDIIYRLPIDSRSLRIFNGNQSPREHLRKLESWFEEQQLRNRDILRWAKRSLRGEAALWADVFCDDGNVRDYQQFKNKFLDKYWSINHQHNVLREVFNGKYTREAQSDMSAYFLKILKRTKDITCISRDQILDLVSTHFSMEVSMALQGVFPKTAENICKILERFDMLENTRNNRNSRQNYNFQNRFSGNNMQKWYPRENNNYESNNFSRNQQYNVRNQGNYYERRQQMDGNVYERNFQQNADTRNNFRYNQDQNNRRNNPEKVERRFQDRNYQEDKRNYRQEEGNYREDTRPGNKTSWHRKQNQDFKQVRTLEVDLTEQSKTNDDLSGNE